MQLVAKIFPKECIDMEIKREYYIDKLIKRQNNGLIKVITDIRRCGKSYLSNTLFYNYLIESDGGVLQREEISLLYLFKRWVYTRVERVS